LKLIGLSRNEPLCSKWAKAEWSKRKPFGGKRRRLTKKEICARQSKLRKMIQVFNRLRRTESVKKLAEHKQRIYRRAHKLKQFSVSDAFRDGQRRRTLRQWTPERRMRQAEYCRAMVRKRDPEKN
jgi:hypothetical protein